MTLCTCYLSTNRDNNIGRTHGSQWRKQVLKFLFGPNPNIPISHQQPGLSDDSRVTPFTLLSVSLNFKQALAQSLPVCMPIFFSVPPTPSPGRKVHRGCSENIS